MPLQNRVDPTGKLHSLTSRGLFMGNKGRLHNENKEIVKQSGWNSWVICSLSHKGIKRELMSPTSYTELFFLDEATALSAGHRPCYSCLKDKFIEFKQRWLEANVNDKPKSDSMSDIDKFNHKERYYRGNKVTYAANMQSLPDGTFIEYEGQYFIIKTGCRYLWSFDGYKSKSELIDCDVNVLTPKSFVAVLDNGYKPVFHDSLPGFVGN